VLHAILPSELLDKDYSGFYRDIKLMQNRAVKELKNKNKKKEEVP
jgi:hypothetical protein